MKKRIRLRKRRFNENKATRIEIKKRAVNWRRKPRGGQEVLATIPKDEDMEKKQKRRKEKKVLAVIGRDLRFSEVNGGGEELSDHFWKVLCWICDEMVWHQSCNCRIRRWGGGVGLGFRGGTRAAVKERLVDAGGEESWVGVPVHQRVDL